MSAEIEIEYLLDCRSTGMGANTQAIPKFSKGVKICSFNESKTGHHWEERIVFLEVGAFVYIRNISNSGKHNCYTLTFVDPKAEGNKRFDVGEAHKIYEKC